MKYHFQSPSGWTGANPIGDAQTDNLRSEILYLEDRIKSTKRMLKDFETRLRRTTASLESHLEYIATLPGPLDRLPPEILSNILVEAARSSYSFLYLLHINRRIRAIAFSTPALWQNVQFLGPASRPSTLSIHSWISRSGVLPLRVSSIVTPWSKNDLRLALIPESHRIVEIDLQMVDLFSLVPLPAAGFPSLRRLSLANRQPWPHLLRETSVSLFSDCPNLTSVSLHFPNATINLAHFMLPLRRLTNLYLSFLDSPQELLDILSECHMLRELDLHFDQWKTLDARRIGDNVILLPLLTSLSLESNCPGETLPRFFDYVSAPSLRSLSIVFDDKDATLSTQLENFVRECDIEDLSLTLSNWQEDEMLQDVFSNFESLRSLTLKFERTKCIDRVVPLLLPWSGMLSVMSIGLPDLERLELWASESIVKVHAWEKLGKERTDPGISVFGGEMLSHFRVWIRTTNIWTGSETYELSIAMGDGMELEVEDPGQSASAEAGRS